MAGPPNIQRLRGLVLSAADLIALTDWPAALVEDYLDVVESIDDDINNLISIIEYVESIKAQTDKNRVSINKDLKEIQNSEQKIEDVRVKADKNKSLLNIEAKELKDLRQQLESINARVNKNKASFLLYFLLAGRTGGQIGYGGTVTGDNLELHSNQLKDGLVIIGDEATGIVYDEDDEAATIGGGEIIHTINGVQEKSLFEFHKDGNTAPGGITFHRHSNTDALSSDIVFLRSKGDHDTPLIVADGSSLGKIRATGFDGTDEAEAVSIEFEVDGTPGNDDMPGRIILKISADGAQVPLEKIRINSGSTYINSLVADHDFIVAGSTEANLFRVDAGEDQGRCGDWDANYFAWDETGDTWWVGSTAGLPYGSLYLHEATVNVDISGAGSGVYVKITGLTTGLLNNVTINSDAFNVAKVGVYKVDWQISADSQGSNLTYEVDIFVNGVEQDDGSSRRKFGAAADYGSMSGTGLIDITNVAHDIDLRIKEVGGAGTDIDIFNLNFNIIQIGGT